MNLLNFGSLASIRKQNVMIVTCNGSLVQPLAATDLPTSPDRQAVERRRRRLQRRGLGGRQSRLHRRQGQTFPRRRRRLGVQADGAGASRWGAETGAGREKGAAEEKEKERRGDAVRREFR